MSTAEYDAQYRRERLADLYILSAAAAWRNAPSGRDLYFIQCGSDGPVKIGVAGNVQSRLASLQTACPYDLRLIGHHSGLGPLERHVHWDFEDVRLRGEWFHPTRTILAMAAGDFPESTISRCAIAPMHPGTWGEVTGRDLEDISERWCHEVSAVRWRLALDWWRSELLHHHDIGGALDTPFSQTEVVA